MQNLTINISIEEYARLKDIETRFTIAKKEMIEAAYCPIHYQIIFGIEEEIKQKQENKTGMLPQE